MASKSPYIKRKRPASFALIFLLIFFGVGLTLFSAWASQWPDPANVGFKQAIGIGARVIAWTLTVGRLFPQFVPDILASINAAGLGWAFGIKAAIAAAIAGFLGWRAARGSLVPRDMIDHLRGAQLFDGKDALDLLRAKLRAGPELFLHPAFTVAPHELGTGVFILGDPGSGKTSILFPLIKATHDRREFFMSLDVKKEQIQKLGDDAHFMGPWLRGSLVWDVGFDTATDAHAEALAAMQISVLPNSSGEVWQAAGCSVLSCLIKHLVKDKPLKWDWRDYANMLGLPVKAWLAIVREIDPVQSKILDVAEVTQSGIVFNITTALRNLKTVAEMFAECEKFGGKKFSIRRWMTEPTYEFRGIVLLFDKEHNAAVGFIVPAMLDYVGMMIDSLPNSTDFPHSFFLDELPQLKPVNSLRTYMEIGRQKGLKTYIGGQTIDQFELALGGSLTNVQYANTSIKVIARTGGNFGGQRKLAESFGVREVTFKSTSQSTSNRGLNASTSIQERSTPVLLPGQLGTDLGPVGSKRDGRYDNGKPRFRPTGILAYIAPLDGNVYRLEWPIMKFPDIRRAPSPLPSQHVNANFARKRFNDKILPLSCRIESARKAIAEEKLKYSDYDLLMLIYSDDHFQEDQMLRCKKVGFARYIEELKTAEAAAVVGSVDPKGEDEGDFNEGRAGNAPANELEPTTAATELAKEDACDLFDELDAIASLDNRSSKPTSKEQLTAGLVGAAIAMESQQP